MSEPREGKPQGANHSTGFTEAIDLTVSGKAHPKSSLRKVEMRKILNKKGGHAKLQWPVTKGGHPATKTTSQPLTRGTRQRPMHTSLVYECE